MKAFAYIVGVGLLSMLTIGLMATINPLFGFAALYVCLMTFKDLPV
jgi:hypothetical protein